ncbi:MAG: PLP-dependent aminotransferase family protein, partial [Trebonia sp.]
DGLATRSTYALTFPALRAGLADYLRRSRALNVTPDNLLVTRGVANGLAAIAAAVIRPGDRVGVEEPGYPSAREVLRRAGAEVIPCPVDEHGVIPEEMPDGLRLLYVTPAHQYPLGGRLPVARRQLLTSWARTTGALIIEDDYDGEFRYDVGPLPALYGMDPDVVIYLGTTSKILTPVLGVGWLVARPDLVSLLARRRTEISERVPEPAQHALLELITSGDLEKHVRRMRLEYARRRDVLMPLPGLRGDTAGMHVVLELPEDCPAGEVVAAAAERGLALSTADRYYVGPATLNALVIGYGGISLAKLRRAVAQLRPLLAGPERGRGAGVRPRSGGPRGALPGALGAGGSRSGGRCRCRPGPCSRSPAPGRRRSGRPVPTAPGSARAGCRKDPRAGRPASAARCPTNPASRRSPRHPSSGRS